MLFINLAAHCRQMLLPARIAQIGHFLEVEMNPHGVGWEVLRIVYRAMGHEVEFLLLRGSDGGIGGVFGVVEVSEEGEKDCLPA